MRVTFLIPGRLETLTGGYGYDRRIVEGLRVRGWTVDVRELDASFPRPTPAALDDAARALAAAADDSLVLVDGLAFGAMPAEIEREAGRLRLAALVHHPLAAESGLSRETAAALEVSERRALGAARLVIVTSRRTASAMESYGVARERVRVVEPGTDRAPVARGSRSPIVHLLCVASLIPRKGHETLFRALARVAPDTWRLTCIGSLDGDAATVEHLRGVLAEERLEACVSLAGEMDGAALAAEYDRADVFVLPTLYEGYGMAVAEALARGLPVVSTATGAIAELVEVRLQAAVRLTADTAGTVRLKADTTYGAGILVPPADVTALARALSAVIGEPDLRARCADLARHVRERLPTWESASSDMAEALAHVQR